LRKFRIAAFAGAATLALTVPAIAQTPDRLQTASLKVTPAKGGSAKKPKNAKLTLEFSVDPTSRTTADKINYFLPKNTKLSGVGFPACSADTINDQGIGACKPASLVGTGEADVSVGSTDVAGPPAAVPPFKVNVYAGGPKKLALYLYDGPAEVAAFDAPITNAGGKFGQKIGVVIPAQAQSVAGLDVYLTNLTTTIGGKKATVRKKGKKKTVYFASLTGCPKTKSHLGAVSIGFVANQSSTESGTSNTVQATSPCKK
jgi:hypothetical protein